MVVSTERIVCCPDGVVRAGNRVVLGLDVEVFDAEGEVGLVCFQGDFFVVCVGWVISVVRGVGRMWDWGAVPFDHVDGSRCVVRLVVVWQMSPPFLCRTASRSRSISFRRLDCVATADMWREPVRDLRAQWVFGWCRVRRNSVCRWRPRLRCLVSSCVSLVARLDPW